jgi:arginase family enzyme
VDSICPFYLNGTGTLADFGLTPREVLFLFKKSFETNLLTGLDVAEINGDLAQSDLSLQKELQMVKNLILKTFE